ncbi:protein phosphatase regulator [Cryptotrichosporon argae]
MAQIIPPITSLPIDSSAAPSVEDIQDRLPSICVDYLSHDWTEEDVWASWRSMTRHKHEIANGVRLENASWRTWQKQRNKLRTISPETLNWLKDSDVTWLYGPLHTASVEPVRPLKQSTTDERYGIDRPSGMKPILKHRTISELLTIPNPSSPILEAIRSTDDIDSDDVASIAGRPALMQTKSDTNILAARGTPRRRSPPRHPITANNIVEIPAPGGAPSPDVPGSGKRHISFNTFVEQRVALAPVRDADAEADQAVNDSEDDMLEMRSVGSSRSSRSGSRPSVSRNSSSSSAGERLIAKIAPTMLKTTGSYNSGNPAMPQMRYQPPPEYVSPDIEVPPSANRQPQSPFDFPSPNIQRWNDNDNEYASVGFDYFGSPDTKASPSHVAHSPYRAPTVNQPPPQPKWRQQADTSPTTSSSSSSLNAGVVSPQPGRSILKVRSPNPVVASPDDHGQLSPPSYFNYNPSVATGIGGMRGTYDSPTSPVVSPPATSATATSAPIAVEERGRSSTRGSGSSQYDRSVSRGTSVSSTSSIGSVSRSPQEPTGTKPRLPVASQPGLDKVQEGTPWSPQESNMDVDYVPERTNTPTPHSSPQIALRSLKDTSPASLPHTSTSYRAPPPSSELPSADPPQSVDRATVAHVPTNAQPTISQPAASRSRSTSSNTLPTDSGASTPRANGKPLLTDADDAEDSTLYGRAATIASSAKDLIGSLWYGDDQRKGGSRRHSRGASLG